jgi:dTDP-4-dehydrorhamnose 3,5-epimerase
MVLTKCEIPGLLVIEPRVFADDRGVFYETFNEQKFLEATGLKSIHFYQDNESISKKNVLRGLHFQQPPFAQGKLVRVVQGKVIDIAVDLRKGSPTYGKHFSVELSSENKKQFWIPEGFAHGFVALEENTIFNYKCTNYYNPESERTIQWDDADLQIDWKISEPIVSEKDKKGLEFSTFVSEFEF